MCNIIICYHIVLRKVIILKRRTVRKKGIAWVKCSKQGEQKQEYIWFFSLHLLSYVSHFPINNCLFIHLFLLQWILLFYFLSPNSSQILCYLQVSFITIFPSPYTLCIFYAFNPFTFWIHMEILAWISLWKMVYV